MKKNIRFILFCVAVVAVLICSAISISAEGITKEVTFIGTDDENYFTAPPGVYEMGDGYAVIWATSFDGIGYITYTYEGVEYTVYDEVDGVLKTGESIHVVKVPYEHLSDNEYTVHSKAVLSHVGDNIEYGVTVSAGPIKLRGYDGEDSIDIIALTDIHTYLDRVVETLSHVSVEPDLFVILGDTIEFSSQMSHIEELFNIIGTISGGQYPVVYCRGNHEAMGEAAPRLRDYFPTETDGMYYDFRFGPLYGVVVDTGADHDDDTDHYSDTVCFRDHSEQEENWLRSLEADTDAKYALAINHIPTIHELPNGIDMTDSMAHLGLQLGISGHEHIVEYIPEGTYDGLGYPAYICGGKSGTDGYVAMLLTFDGDEVRLKAVDMSGNTVHENTVALERNYGRQLEAEEHEKGLNGQVKLRSSTFVNITAGPVVIETGDDCYTVVWMTDKVTSGAVEYTYNGKTYQVFEDQIGGRIFDTVHSVKVPKEHLNGNSYSVISYNMEKFYPYGPVRGKGVRSDVIEFADMKSLGEIKAAYVTEAKPESDESEYKAYIIDEKIVGSFDTEEDIAALITAASEISAGKLPVVISRDEDGYSGAYATELIGYVGSGGTVHTEDGKATVTFVDGEKAVYAIDDEEDIAADRLLIARRMFYIASRILKKY
ncbi:MAG: hypothetical protein E7628_02090 [Ruminococcaceae bacterium]|nr:hypothetical protein [Oscillospiraceae bacterium]